MKMKKSTRRELAYQTLDIIKEGKYFANGRSQLIGVDTQNAIDNSVLYTPEDFADVRHEAQRSLSAPRQTTVFEVNNETTLDACRRLATEEGEENVLALNFASARNAGGGFLGGAQAQEESLARSSSLYPTLTANETYYTVNRAQRSLYYTDHMIWSPKVPVFRQDDGELIPSYLVSFLTAPAVNAGALKNNNPTQLEGVKEAMRERIQKVLDLCVVNKHDVLVLGAWGCGVFRNKPEDIAELFGDHLLRGAYQGVFKKVVFAVLDNAKEQIIAPFSEQFNNK